MKKYKLVREDINNSNQVDISKSDNIHYLNKKMEDCWLKELEEVTKTNPEVERCYFVNEYARISGVARWWIIENK